MHRRGRQSILKIGQHLTKLCVEHFGFTFLFWPTLYNTASTCTPKIREKYFSGNYCVKLGHFLGKTDVEFRNFVNFSENIIKIRVFCYFFGQESCKILAFC